MPKYLNSSESSIYHKRKSFYGLLQAAETIRRERHVYITEGYLDVISLFQAGIKNVLATCGTAATEQHVQVLKRLVDRVTLLFDGDEAGRKAAARCFEIFLNTGLDLEVVVLPEGNDPDSLVHKVRPDNIKEYVDSRGETAPKFYLSYLIQEHSGSNSIADCSPAVLGKIAQTYSAIVSKVKNPVEKEFLLKIAAEKLGVNLDSLGSLAQAEEKKQHYREKTFHSSKQETAEERAIPSSRVDRKSLAEETLNKNISKQKLGKLYKQLLVAIVSEPFLAQVILENSTLTEDDSSFTANLPQKINNFINEILHSEIKGVVAYLNELKRYAKEIKLEPSFFPQLQELLKKYNLDNYGILEESIRQVLTGGASPADSISKGLVANSVVHLSQYVEIIKENEIKVESEEEKLKLAQEKLQKKRTLEQLVKK